MRYISIAAVVACLALLATPLLRSASTSNQQPDTAEAHLLFVGDLMMGRYVAASMSAHGYDSPFAGVRAFVSGADLAVGNLEGPLVPTAFGLPGPYHNL